MHGMVMAGIVMAGVLLSLSPWQCGRRLKNDSSNKNLESKGCVLMNCPLCDLRDTWRSDKITVMVALIGRLPKPHVSSSKSILNVLCCRLTFCDGAFDNSVHRTEVFSLPLVIVVYGFPLFFIPSHCLFARYVLIKIINGHSINHEKQYSSN